MTWAKGKQLSTMTKGEQTLSFKYDANGIRTKKTVNNVEYEYTYVGDKLVRVESDGLDYGPL
ncbi:MAG: RHS repeat-associated core domain-containing protein, partial [Clostridia bacterium]|nr:RHS repeat-associated core domain-containing protein [Clostridia bacterium]